MKILCLIKTHFSSLVTILNSIGVIVIPILIVSGKLQPSNPKIRMKKKIIRKLTDKANKDIFLIPEIRLRDGLVFQRFLFRKRYFLRKFYTTFIESIRELETEQKIICVKNSEFGISNKETEEEYPSYSSKAKKNASRL